MVNYLAQINIIKNFCKIIIRKYNNENINFFNLYNSDQYNRKYNFLFLKEEEIGAFNSLPICYRSLYVNKLFSIEYIVKHICTGEYKYKSKILEKKHIPPFIEVLHDHLKDDILSINEIIFDNYFKTRNIACNEDIF